MVKLKGYDPIDATSIKNLPHKGAMKFVNISDASLRLFFPNT